MDKIDYNSKQIIQSNAMNRKFFNRFFSFFRKELISPVSGKVTLSDVEAFVKKVNAGSSISSQLRSDLPQLRKHSMQIKEWYTETLEKCCELFDGLPRSTLETVFGGNAEVFLKLKVLKQSLKAKTKVVQRSIEKLETEDVQDLTHYDEPALPTPSTASSRFTDPPSSFDYGSRQSTFEPVRPSTFEPMRPSNFESSAPSTAVNDDFGADMFGADMFGADDFDEYDLMVSRSNLGKSAFDSTGFNGTQNGFSPQTPTTISQQSTSQQSQKSNSSHLGNFYSGTKNDGITGEFDGYVTQ